MIYLTPSQVLFIHARIQQNRHVLERRLRDLGLLAAAAARPQATFGRMDLYPNLFHKAAALMDSIVHNHPFVDGNKRVCITAAGLFLQLNGRRLVASNADLESFTLTVARGETDQAAMAAWFEQQSEPYHG